MPLPLIGIAIAAAAVLLGIGAVFGIPELLKTLAGKKVAILGRQRVGKTTLFEFLRDRELPKHSSDSVDPGPGGKFRLQVNEQAVDFEVPIDVIGNQSLHYADWKSAFDSADHVWYLFRSDLISQEDPSEVQLVKEQLDMLKSWRDARKPNPPRILLVGTYADLDPLYQADPAGLLERVHAADPINLGQVKLKGRVVVGSLASEEGAKDLIASIGKRVSK